MTLKDLSLSWCLRETDGKIKDDGHKKMFDNSTTPTDSITIAIQSLH